MLDSPAVDLLSAGFCCVHFRPSVAALLICCSTGLLQTALCMLASLHAPSETLLPKTKIGRNRPKAEKKNAFERLRQQTRRFTPHFTAVSLLVYYWYYCVFTLAVAPQQRPVCRARACQGA